MTPTERLLNQAVGYGDKFRVKREFITVMTTVEVSENH